MATACDGKILVFTEALEKERTAIEQQGTAIDRNRADADVERIAVGVIGQRDRQCIEIRVSR